VHVPELAWPTTAAQARAEQDRLRPLVRTTGSLPAPLRTVAGLDVAYGGDDRLAAAVVVLDADTLAPVDQATAVGVAAFDYVPGLFAFRELPALLAALAALSTVPDVLVCDGHGLAHPRRFGLACHLGVLLDRPTIGIAKTPLSGRYEPPGPRRGAGSALLADGEVVGRALRTRDGVKPVYVSVGHRLDLDAACALALRLTPRYRLPETTRRADRLCRDALALAAAG
jgi:deoxyribonuclease V